MPVTKAKGDWRFLKCVTGHEEKYTLTKGTDKTEEWSLAASFPGAAAAKALADGALTVSSTTTFEESVRTAQEVTIDPGTDKQLCLWQWRIQLHGPPGLGTVTTATDEFLMTPHPDMKPRCLPGRFDLTADSKNYQVCQDAKSRID